jgi:hypothetical protein
MTLHDVKEVLDSIDTPGAHILLCLLVGIFGTLLGIWVTWMFWPDKQLAVVCAGLTGSMTGFLQVAMYAMRGREPANGKNDTPQS